MKQTLKRPAEQEAPQLQVIQDDDARQDADPELERPDPTEQEKVENFWAGRNHAMRRSARIAA